MNGRLPNTFFSLINNEDLIDVWRKRNPKTRDYTYYSDRHKTWSRIDMVWATKELDTLTEKAEILTSSLSDHNPMLWQMIGGIYCFRRWRLNEDILDNSDSGKFEKGYKRLFRSKFVSEYATFNYMGHL